MEEPAGPSVLVVLVASEGAEAWLPEVLSGLAAQTHRPLDMVALDNATTDGSSALLQGQLGNRRLVRVEAPLTYAKAVGRLLATAHELGFTPYAYLFLHDDCALDPDAIEIMLDSLAVEEVGIVAPRLVDWNQPEVLQDVGQTTDRFGRAVPRVERGELDQGQLEGTRAVLYAQSAALLVDATLIERIGAFDERFDALREDLDLCWRARICGALTVVANEARARHVQATVRGGRPGPAKGRLRELADRHLIAGLLKNYGWRRVWIAVPVTIAISLANAVLFLAAGRRRLAAQAVRAIGWNITHLGSTLAARRRVQSIRTANDAAVARLQHKGTHRLRVHAVRIIERIVGGEVHAPEDVDFDAPPPTLWQRIRSHPTAIIAILALILGVIATRGIFAVGPLAGADHGRFPAEPAEFFREFASGFRGTSGAGAATPGLVLLGIWSTITFASTWLAHRLLLAAIVPLAAFSAARLVRRLGLGRGPQVVGGIAYALGPCILGAYADGRMIEGMVAIGLPVLVGRLLVAPAGGATARTGFGIVAVTTILVASLAPWMLVGVVLCGIAVTITRRTLMPVRMSALVAVVASLALLPWSVDLFRDGSPVLAGGGFTEARWLDLVTLDPHGLLRVAVSFGLVTVAIFGAALARPRHRQLAVDAGGLVFVGLAAAIAGSVVPALGPRPGLPLILAAIGAAILAALAMDAARPVLVRRAFGAPHLAAAIVLVASVAQGVGTVSFLATGAHPGLSAGRGLVPEFFELDADRGDFRVLWLDGTSSRPRFALTGATGLTMVDHLERPAGGAYGAAARAVEIISGRAGAAAGRILATVGVRYVIVRPTASDELAIAVGDQIELTLEQEVGGAKIFRNAINMPVAAALRAPAWARVSGSDLDGAQGVEANPAAGDPFRRERSARYRGTAPRGTRLVMLGQPFDTGWIATVGELVLEPRVAFGWATAFDLEEPTEEADEPVRIMWRGQGRHRVMLLAWLLGLLVLAAAWRRGASGEDLR